MAYNGSGVEFTYNNKQRFGVVIAGDNEVMTVAVKEGVKSFRYDKVQGAVVSYPSFHTVTQNMTDGVMYPSIAKNVPDELKDNRRF